MAEEVRRSLLQPLPTLPSKYFYDDRGSELFEQITRLPEYYQTRTEEKILAASADSLIERLKPRELVELGSGVSRKVSRLLDAMEERRLLEACVLFDINDALVSESVARLQAAHPAARLSGVVGDFQHDLAELGPGGGRLLLFLAGTVGNLYPDETGSFFRGAASILAPGDGFLLGVDLVKDEPRLHAAYNDSAGVTAEFNLNILRVMNERLGATFDLESFEHRAFYDRANAWIEMRVRARRPTRVNIESAGIDLRFSPGDEIRTEISAKYTRESLLGTLAGSGLILEDFLTDEDRLFAVALLRRAG